MPMEFGLFFACEKLLKNQVAIGVYMAKRNLATAVKDGYESFTNRGENPLRRVKDKYEDYTSRREGPIARSIESQTAKLPSDLFLWAAFGSMVVSAFLQANERKEQSLFIGQWAPSFLLLGIYNKIVKTQGSD